MKNVFRGYIYCHTSPSGKMYVGQTRASKVEHRWSGKDPYAGSTVFYNAICKYGWDNFTHSILAVVEAPTKEELISSLNYYEEKFISDLQTVTPKGYNIRPGGNVTTLHPETIEKIRAKNKLYVPTLEARRKQSIAQMGRVVTEETRKKLSIANKGRVFGEAFRYKCSIGKLGNKNALGHTLSNESVQKMLATKKANGTYNWTEKHYETIRQKQSSGELHWKLSDEAKRHISEGRKGIVFSEEHRKHLSESQKGKSRPNSGQYKRTPDIQWKIYKKRLLSGTYYSNSTSPHKGESITEEQFMTVLMCHMANRECTNVPTHFVNSIYKLIDRLGYPCGIAEEVTESVK